MDLIEATLLQADLIKKGVCIMVKHYTSGTYAFTVDTHNGDATGWTKVSPFMTKSHYTYLDALIDGFNWYEKYKEELDNPDSKPDTDFGALVKYDF